MSAVSLPVTRPTGRALVVGQPACRSAPVAALARLGFACAEVDEPYDAMIHLCRRPLFYSALILSLNSLYREELQIIASIKRRYSHIEVWLSDTDGRQAALAEAMRLGADGLVAEDGLHRIGGTAAPATVPSAAEPQPSVGPNMASGAGDRDFNISPKPPGRLQSTPPAENAADPLLTAEELRALLQENPTPHAD